MQLPVRERETSVLSSSWSSAVEVNVRGLWPRRTRTRTVVRYRDWLVDGKPLRDWLGYGDPRDDARPLMWETAQYDRGVIASLRALLAEDVGSEKESVSFPDGRTAILFCGACGDMWCGAISARVDVGEEIVEWRDIAFQDADEISVDGPTLTLRFERREYERTIRDLINGWR